MCTWPVARGPPAGNTHTQCWLVGLRERQVNGLGHARKHCTTLYWVSVCVCVAKMAGCVSTCKDEKAVYMYVKEVVRSAKIQSTSLCVSLCIRLVALLVFFGILQVCRYAYFSFDGRCSVFSIYLCRNSASIRLLSTFCWVESNVGAQRFRFGELLGFDQWCSMRVWCLRVVCSRAYCVRRATLRTLRCGPTLVGMHR